MSDRLRVAAVVDGMRVPRWVSQALGDIAGAEGIHLVTVLVSPRSRRSRRHSGVLFRLYELIDAWLFRTRPDALGRVELPMPVTERAAPHPDGEADVVLDLRPERGPGGLAQRARHGTWWVRFGDSREYRGGPPLFWEMYERNPVSGVELVVDRDGRSQALYRSMAATRPASLYRNRNNAAWKGAAAIPRRLESLRRGGFDELGRLPGYGPAPTGAPTRGCPTARQVVRHAGRVARWVFMKTARELLFPHQWFLAYRRCERRQPPAAAGGKFSLAVPPLDRYWADPFLLSDGELEHVFFEDYRRPEGRAVISAVTIGPRGELSEPRVVLSADSHLSYPFVFRSNGDVFMLPESSAARTLRLYRARRLPDDWEPVAELMSGVRAVDPTLLFHDGLWWLFAALPADGAPVDDELHVFSAKSLLSEWTAHPMNPVVSDVRRARPAGAVYRDGERLIRPSQDSSRSYGCGIVLNRIDELTSESYREVPIDRIEPDWMPRNTATHTYNADNRYEVVDGCLRPARFHLPLLHTRRPWAARRQGA